MDNDNNNKNDSILSSKKQSTLFQYLGCPIHVSRVSKFKRLVLCATISLDLHFDSNRILTKATNKVQTMIKELACKDKIEITIAFDGWHNIVNQELMDAKELNIRVNSLITDLARVYTAAHHSLRCKIYNKIIIHCFAHQANCYISGIFKKSSESEIQDEKVIAMSQLCTEILHAYKKKSDSNYIQLNNFSFTSILSNTSTSNTFISIKELLINEEFEEEMDDLDTEIEFLDLEIHLTENQAA
ncbi:39348_t:CDS:2, partial [Gigaspora margarita]